MRFNFTKLMADVSNKTRNRIKVGFKLFRKSEEEPLIVVKKTSRKKSKKPSNLAPEISVLQKALSYSPKFNSVYTDGGIKFTESDNTEKSLLSSLSMQKGFLAPPMGVSVINDFFNKSITTKENK